MPLYLLAFFLFFLSPLHSHDIPPSKVYTTTAKSSTLEATLSAVGKIGAANSVELQTQIEGVLTTLPFNEGDFVEKGALLAKIVNPLYEEELKIKEAEYTQSLLKFQKSQDLLQHDALSVNRFKELEAKLLIDEAQKNKQAHWVEKGWMKAPFAGYLGPIQLSIDSYLPQGTFLFRLQDHRKVNISFQLPERLLSKVSLGQKLRFSPSFNSELSFEGTVSYIDKQLSPDFPFALVKGEIPNPDLQLLPNMNGQVFLSLEQPRQAVLVSKKVLVIEGEQTFFYYVKEGLAHKFIAELGQEKGEWVEVKNWEDLTIPLILEGKFRIWQDKQPVEILK